MIVLSWLWGIVKSVLNTIARAVAFVVILVIILAGIVFQGEHHFSR